MTFLNKTQILIVAIQQEVNLSYPAQLLFDKFIVPLRNLNNLNRSFGLVIILRQ